MQIREILPRAHASSVHRIPVQAPVDVVSEALRRLDLGGSAAIRLLFRLRGLPPAALTMAGLEHVGFTLLHDRAEEVVLGMIGRPWTSSGGIRSFPPEEFASFQEPGYARIAWNFHLDPLEERLTRVTTETRVHCTDEESRRRFLLYWRLVGPFSGWTRREMLRLLRKEAEGR